MLLCQIRSAPIESLRLYAYSWPGQVRVMAKSRVRGRIFRAGRCAGGGANVLHSECRDTSADVVGTRTGSESELSKRRTTLTDDRPLVRVSRIRDSYHEQ